MKIKIPRKYHIALDWCKSYEETYNFPPVESLCGFKFKNENLRNIIVIKKPEMIKLFKPAICKSCLMTFLWNFAEEDINEPINHPNFPNYSTFSDYLKNYVDIGSIHLNLKIINDFSLLINTKSVLLEDLM